MTPMGSNFLCGRPHDAYPVHRRVHLSLTPSVWKS